VSRLAANIPVSSPVAVVNFIGLNLLINLVS
jgi:hypothetical protein